MIVAPRDLREEPKSEASDAYVWLPQSLALELDF